MRKNEKRAFIFRIVIDIALIAAATTLLLWLRLKRNYEGFWFPILFFFDIIFISKLFFDLRAHFAGTPKKGRIKRLIKKLFRPIIAKFEKKKEEKKKYIRGETERSFVFGFGRNRRGPRFDSRIKANLKKCRTNAEKLRMMYIRKVLELRSRGKDVTPSKTPREMEKLLSPEDNRKLFENYSRMRYEKDFVVDDETLAECGDTK